MTKKEILRLLIVYLVITGVIVVGTLALKKRFSEAWLDKMINSRGSGIQLTTDPCAYAIVGDPDAAEKYIKLVVRCNNGKQSWNTFDTRAVQADTLEQLINEFQRINGISAETKLYKCKLDNKPIDLLTKLRNSITVECTYEK